MTTTFIGTIRVVDLPECEGCRRPAALRINGLYVCLDHADLASEADGNEIEELEVVACAWPQPPDAEDARAVEETETEEDVAVVEANDDDDLCRECGEETDLDGWDGLCGNCADAEEDDDDEA